MWWQDAILVLCGGFIAFVGMFMGAFFVYRTKRDPHDAFLNVREPKGEAFNLDDGTTMPDYEPTEIPPAVEKLNEEFKKQMADAFNLGSKT